MGVPHDCVERLSMVVSAGPYFIFETNAPKTRPLHTLGIRTVQIRLCTRLGSLVAEGKRIVN